jgi:hypothetical protein
MASDEELRAESRESALIVVGRSGSRRAKEAHEKRKR